MIDYEVERGTGGVRTTQKHMAFIEMERMEGHLWDGQQQICWVWNQKIVCHEAPC